MAVALLLVGCSFNPPVGPLPSASSSPASTVIPNDGLPADGRPLRPVPGVRPPGFVDPPPGSGGSRYRKQMLDWRPCRSDLLCATVRVPLDWRRPNGTAITLALAKQPATGSRRLGTLFLNPGGPGGSGVEYVDSFDHTGLEDYDIVGWDPRGVGGSTPVSCFGPAALDQLYAVDISPDDDAELRALISEDTAFGRSCLEASGVLLQHISTADTVRDLDLLRELVGDTKINYFGSSYGTRIGSAYAQRYPQRVGRMVLDGAVNVQAKVPITQTEGFERALGHFADWCARQPCRLGTSRDDVLYVIGRFLGDLDQRPLAVGPRMLSQQQGLEAVFFSLYAGQSGWDVLLGALNEAVFTGRGDGLLRLADVSNQRGADGRYGQISYAFPAIRCLDSPDRSVRAAQRRLASAALRAPVLGRLGGADLLCPLWPVASAPELPTVTADGAPPIVVIGTTGDPATPYEYAVGMADQLRSGVLVTFRGEGHLAYGQSPCIRALVAAYLMRDVVPADRTTC